MTPNASMATLSGSAANITLTQLAYAVAVDTHRHFERAARACNVTQPTLSMQLRKLETALGATLFDRSSTPVIPTDIGTVLIEQARVVLLESARLGELCDAASGVIAGELRLGVIPTLAPYLLPNVLEVAAERHPQLEIVIEERVTETVFDGLRDDTLDAGLVATVVNSPGIISRTLFREPFFGYVSPGHRLAGNTTLEVGALSLDDLWLLSEGHCLRTQVVTLCQQRSKRRNASKSEGPGCTRLARFESGNLETLKRLVERGLGMTLLPALAAAALGTNAQRRMLIPFADPAPGRVIRLVRRRRHSREQAVRAVMAIIREVAATVLSKPGQKIPPR